MQKCVVHMHKYSKIWIWDDIQSLQSELTNQVQKCWCSLSIITEYWAQLYSPRQIECLNMQRQRSPLYPNEQDSARLQTTVTRITALHSLNAWKLTGQDQHRVYKTNLNPKTTKFKFHPTQMQ